MRDGSTVARSITKINEICKTRAKDNMQGRVLTIHLVEGTASGLQTAEIDNWIGKVFVAPRPELPNLLRQPELRGLGVYILIGDDPNQTGRNIIYIGQGALGGRLNIHSSDKDKAFWDNKTIVVTGNLNNSACLYLESRLIELAVKAGIAEVTNGQKPSLPYMSNPDKTTAENFLEQIQVLLPVLNVDYFVQPPTITSRLGSLPTTATKQIGSIAQVSPRFVFVTGGVSAEAELINNKFVVIEGSLVNPIDAASIGKSNSALRSQLRASGKLVDDITAGRWIFSEDVAFNSPSAAAAVVSGFSVAGPQVWKIKDTQQTYGAWQQAQVDLVSSPATP